MGEYIYKRVDESMYEDLVQLYRSAFNQQTTINYYKLKFDTAYLGVKHLGFIAYDTIGNAVAFYGVFPQRVKFKDKLYLAAQSGDTMTHPSHGGKGLFTTLAKMTYELAKNEGIQFVFGFPNKNSYPGFTKKLSWKHNENMVNYQWNVRTLPLAAIAKKLPALSYLYQLYSNIVFHFFKSNSSIEHSINANEFGIVYRDDNYFKYKSFLPNKIIRAGDLTCWVKVDGALMVGDANVNNIDWKYFKNQISKIAFWLGCNKVIFPVGKDTSWDLKLKNNVTSEEGIFIGYLNLNSDLPLEKFKFMMSDFDTF
jgi:hypothetical protein